MGSFGSSSTSLEVHCPQLPFGCVCCKMLAGHQTPQDWPQAPGRTFANFPPTPSYGMHYQGQASSLSSPHYFPQFGRPQFGDFGGAVPAPPAGGRQDFNQNFRGGPPRGRGMGRGGHAIHDGDWTCPSCSGNVFASRNECFRCSTPRPAGAGGRGYGGRGGGSFGGSFYGPFSGGPPRREGDWTCPTCSANVFASRSECFRCHTPKPGGAAVVRAPSGGRGYGSKRGGYNGGSSFVGPFSGGPPRREGDWTCPTCSANVYATRTACFRCSTPKPAGTQSAGLIEGSTSGGFGEAAAFENQQDSMAAAGLPARRS